ncbi:MAG: hypothetical protein KAT32_04305 [Candidatus Moranbacteria bacterium]|nr:hypothetical protein [Candidatus Moranbacteria bacterium]
MKKAVLFLIFNRIDTVQRVFAEIQKAKPPRFYLASDEGRNEEEKKKVKKIRDYVLNNINWDCEVKTLFRDKNLGCRRSVSGAISWFFKNEKDGIILEDDCLPSQSFFNFCEELLDYYKDNKSVWHISGNQFFPILIMEQVIILLKFSIVGVGQVGHINGLLELWKRKVFV